MQFRQQLQARAFRATLRKFAAEANQQPQQQQARPQTKKLRTSQIVLGDFGNLPLVLANSVGACAILAFGMRKLFFHPDVAIAEVNRFSPEVQNETPQRMESAAQFRDQTRFFASILQPISSFIISTVTGVKQGHGDDETDQWSLGMFSFSSLLSFC